MINKGRHSATADQDVVVFLIGARLNHLWRLDLMIKTASHMAGMQKELRNPELGCLATFNWGGRTSLSLQYWRDYEALEAYAHASTHLKAWRDYASDGAIGIWHETYVKPQFEAVYVNMPDFGLGKAGGLVPAKGDMKTSRKRLESSLK